MKIYALLLAVVLAAGGILLPKQAFAAGEPAVMDDKWHFELTPYVWLAGISDDVTVNGNKSTIDISFDDLKNNLQMAGSFLTYAAYNQLIFGMQFDYIGLGNDRVTTDTVFLSAGGGWKFKGPFEGSSISVLFGVRYLYVDTTLKITGGPFSHDTNIVDPAFFVHPSIPIMKKRLKDRLRFSPAFSVGGGGDSDLIYEFEPMLQIRFTDSIAARVGYRTLHYKYTFGPNSNSNFNGEFSGPMVGLGINFG